MNIDQGKQKGNWASLAGWPVLILDETGSSNDDCLELADFVEGEFVIWAKHQTEGKGRENRQWLDSPGSSLTFSVLLRPSDEEKNNLNRFTVLGALALCDLLENAFDLTAEIKWPNDVLIHRKKICGILSEVKWIANVPTALVLGIGINLGNKAFGQAGELRFPATSLEAEGFPQVDALSLLEGLLYSLNQRRKRLSDDGIIQDWNDRLAFRSEFVPIKQYQGKTEMLCPEKINLDGSLSVHDQSGTRFQLHSAEFSEPSSSSDVSSTS